MPRFIWTPSISLPKAVIVCESAFDALAAEAFGHDAVAAPGARTWRPEWAAQLHRQGVREAIVVFDCDGAGRAGAPRVARSLRDHAISARVVDLDPGRAHGGDIADFLLAERERGRV
jgi:DNA primase